MAITACTHGNHSLRSWQSQPAHMAITACAHGNHSLLTAHVNQKQNIFSFIRPVSDPSTPWALAYHPLI